MRTFVSFEADFPTSGDPPGREVAEFVFEALEAAGLTNDRPSEREGWAWDIISRADRLTIETVVGLVDDPPRQWQVHTYGHLPLSSRWSRKAKARRDETLQRWSEAIDAALKGDVRVRSVRWYDPQTFDKDYGETWHPVP